MREKQDEQRRLILFFHVCSIECGARLDHLDRLIKRENLDKSLPLQRWAKKEMVQMRRARLPLTMTP